MTPFQRAAQNPAPEISASELSKEVASRPTDKLITALSKAKSQLLTIDAIEAQGFEDDNDGPFPATKTLARWQINYITKQRRDLYRMISFIEYELNKRTKPTPDPSRD